MGTQKDFVFLSRKLIAYVDFLKWTSTFGEGSIRQIEEPMRGFQLSASLLDLFGFARDDTGLMVTMEAAEAPWLEHLPFSAAVYGYDGRTSLLLVTSETPMMDLTIPSTGMEIFVPLTRLQELQGETLIGFCLVRKGVPQRVGRIIRLYTPETFSTMLRSQRSTSTNTGGLFSGA
jgi:hypothetical protein